MVEVLRVVVVGPLAQSASGFAADLSSRGYTPLSATNLVRVFADLSRWLQSRGLRPRDLRVERLDEFLRSRRRRGFAHWTSMRGLDPLVDYLRRCSAVPPPRSAPPRTVLERLLASYRAYLVSERALAEKTILRRVQVAARFLSDLDVSRAALRDLSPVVVRKFLGTESRSRRYSAASMALVGSDLRALLRFFFAEGRTRRSLAEAVPSSAGWRLTSLPRAVSRADVGKLLRSCDRRTAFGRRDFAILVLLVRLGLRAGEVLAIELDDIDWRAGEIVIHGKGAKRERLPLPADVGKALSEYVLRRPRVIERRVFLRLRAPYRPLSAVQQIVFAASQRAGLPVIRPHRLRHTAATEMLRAGARLAEIAQVLRHGSTQTTAIYAKVDRTALRTIAQSWPGARA